MPRTLWVLVCKGCKIVFSYTDPGKAGNAIELLLPREPDFPLGGKQLACPHCSAEATYKRSDLKYHFRLD